MRKKRRNIQPFNAVIRPARGRKKNAIGWRGFHISFPFFLNFGLSHRTKFVIFGLVVVFFSLFSYIFFSEQFSITDVRVIGASSEARERVENFYALQSRSRYFLLFQKDKTILFPIDDFRSNLLNAVPEIKIAEVQTDMPHALIIRVEERTIEGVWCGERGECYFFDETGVIYDEAPDSPRGALITLVRDRRGGDFKLGDTVLSAELLDYIDKLNKGLELSYKKPAYISVQDEDELRTGFASGAGIWEAYFSRSNTVISQIESLNLVLDEEIGNDEPFLSYIDLRFGSKVFYKFRD